ncbi:hypothetical protein [Methylacidiphilum sp. Yel]|nr:hypothetical protein [Methylacidiphilum sp. Yel]
MASTRNVALKAIVSGGNMPPPIAFGQVVFAVVEAWQGASVV